jgi:nitrite reductase/ring-hydroxylating ferredoxin subunit
MGRRPIRAQWPSQSSFSTSFSGTSKPCAPSAAREFRINEPVSAGGDFVAVARLTDVDETRPAIVRVGEYEVALFLVDGDVRAYENACPHQGGPIGEGQIEGTTVTCPWHAWTFDLHTGGMALGADFARLRRFEARVQDGRIEVATEPEAL